MFDLCPPALIYLFFSSTQIMIDLYKGLYNTAFFKFIIMIMVTILLNTLCQGGLGIVSWIIVFIPFIFMTVVVSILLYVFGLNAATGAIQKPHPPPNQNNIPPPPNGLQEKDIIIVNPYPLHGMSKYSTIHVYENVNPPPNPNNPQPPPPQPLPPNPNCPICKDCPPPPPPNYCIPKPPPNGSSSPAYQSFSKY
jgi:hypothetical protein